MNYAGLPHDLAVGDRVLVNNGLVIFEVQDLTETDVHCRVVVGGELSNRKSMSFPNKVLHQIYLSEQDKDDLPARQRRRGHRHHRQDRESRGRGQH